MFLTPDLSRAIIIDMTDKMVYLDAKRVRELLDISQITFLRWLKAGVFPGAVKAGAATNAAWRIPAGDVERKRLARVSQLSQRLSRISRSAYDG